MIGLKPGEKLHISRGIDQYFCEKEADDVTVVKEYKRFILCSAGFLDRHDKYNRYNFCIHKRGRGADRASVKRILTGEYI